jgi:hypothetical protein
MSDRGSKYILDFTFTDQQFVEMANGLTKASPFAALEHLPVSELAAAVTKYEPMTSLGQAITHGQSLFEQMRPFRDLQELARPFHEFQQLARPFHEFQELARPVRELHEQMRSVLPHGLDGFSQTIGSALPSLLAGYDLTAKVGDLFPEREPPAVGLLAAFGRDDVTALLASTDRRGEVSVSTFLRQPPPGKPRPAIAIPADVRCYICKGHLLVLEQRVYVDDTGERRHDVEAFPFCTACLERLRADGGLLDRWLSQALRAHHRLVGLPSVGESDGVPRGELRLVQRDDDGDDDGEEP